MVILDNFFISIILIGICLVAIAIPGILLAIFLVDKKSTNSHFWALVPFLGISLSILVLQTLVYLNIPLSCSVFPFFILIVIVIFLIYRTGKVSFPAFPKKLFVFALLALFISGTGYFLVGANDYTGDGYIDQFNYVAITQFLMDKPINTNFADIQQTPYLVTALLKKDDRLGQSILQGYVAILSGVNAKTAYGAISLLSPFLVFISSFLLCQRVIPLTKYQYGASLTAAIIPGLAMVHLENFLSQSLAIPLLLLWPLIIESILEEGNWKNILIGILIFSAIYSIYPDFTIILILLSILGLIWHCATKKEWTPSVKRITILLIGGLFLNVGYIQKSIGSMNRPLVPHLLENIYPFSFKIEGLRYLWFGDLGFFSDKIFIFVVFNFAAISLTILAYVGIFNNFREKKNIISIILLGFVIFPLIILAFGDLYPYQYYKMVLSISPVLMIGVWLTITTFWIDKPKDSSQISSPNNFPYAVFTKLPVIFLALLLIFTVIGTVYTSSNTFFGGGRSINGVSNSKEMIETYKFLESQKNQNFIISSVSVHPAYPLAWASYHGRNNHIYFFDNNIGDIPLSGVYAEKFSFNDPNEFPVNLKKIVVGSNYPTIIPNDLNQNLTISIEIPTEGNSSSNFNWLGKEMTISMYSMLSENTNITLSFDAYPGPGNPDRKRIINVFNTEQPNNILGTQTFDSEKLILIPLTLKPGVNQIKVQTIYPETTTILMSYESGGLLVHIDNMTIVQ